MQDLTVEEHPGNASLRAGSGPSRPPRRGGRSARRAVRRAHRAQQVLIAAGATGALGAAVGALVAPGEEVLLAAPYWPLIAGIVRSFHGRPVDVPVVGEAESADEAVARFEASAHGTHGGGLLEYTPQSDRSVPAGGVARSPDGMGART